MYIWMPLTARSYQGTVLEQDVTVPAQLHPKVGRRGGGEGRGGRAGKQGGREVGLARTVRAGRAGLRRGGTPSPGRG